MHASTKLAVLAALASLAVPAHAQSVYVIADGTDGSNTSYQFGTIDLQTGNFTNIATNAAYSNIFGLGFGTNGALYALSDDGTPSAPVLDEFTIDQGTGTLANEVTFTGDSLFGGSADSRGVFTGLTDPGTTQRSALFTLDLAGGTLTPGHNTLINPNGLVVPDGAGHIFASDVSPTTGNTNGLDEIENPATGASFPVGATGVFAVYTGIFINGSLFTVAEDTNRNSGVYTLDTSTGAANFVTTTTLGNGGFVQALALAPSPEPSGVVAVLVGIVGVGALAVRARRKPSVNT